MYMGMYFETKKTSINQSYLFFDGKYGIGMMAHVYGIFPLSKVVKFLWNFEY